MSSYEELISIKNRLDKILNSGKEPVYCEELITTGELQRLLEEIERLRDKILKLETDASIYKDLSNLRQERINKAIEYINSDEMLKLREDFEYCNDKDLFDEFTGYLDRILRGSDKE